MTPIILNTAHTAGLETRPATLRIELDHGISAGLRLTHLAPTPILGPYNPVSKNRTRETRYLVRAAILACGYQWPTASINASVTSTDWYAEYDLALAVGILAATNQIGEIDHGVIYRAALAPNGYLQDQPLHNRGWSLNDLPQPE